MKIDDEEQLKKFYESIIPKLQEEARDCGWALAVHGSMRRDLDLIAVPWDSRYCTPNSLAQRLQEIASPAGWSYAIKQITKLWQKKPRGRRAIALVIAGVSCGVEIAQKKKLGQPYLDISVFEPPYGLSAPKTARSCARCYEH
jgi:hypothetical protein